MALKRDVDEERAARLDALTEEYRVKTDDTRQKVREVQKRIGRASAVAKANLDAARRRKK